MKSLKDYFKDKDKKHINNLVLFLGAGVLLILASGFLKSSEGNNQPVTVSQPPEKIVSDYPGGYELEMAKRLEEILSLVDGAGRVKIMLTTASGGEKIIRQDSTIKESSTNETDNEGGARSVRQFESDDKTVMMRQPDGSDLPLVLSETKPTVEGVIIIAEGGDNVAVKDSLTKAVEAVLGMAPHKIQVLKMKT